MNITFLIGNGFDLGIGLETSYHSFYSWYGTQPSDSTIIKQFKDEILLDIATESSTWADLEAGLGNYASNFSPENVNAFYICYDDIQSKLVEYLSLEEKRIDYAAFQSDIISVFRKSLLEFFSELTAVDRASFETLFQKYNNQNHFYNFVLFNYTYAFDNCIQTLCSQSTDKVIHARKVTNLGLLENKIGQLIHIHGYTDDTPILGVNDISQINNNLLCQDRAFCVTMIKPDAVDAAGENRAGMAEQLVAQANIVCIYGMSIGNTDLKWWRQIGQWLKASSERKLILFSYGNPLDKISLRARVETVEQTKAYFLQQSGLSESDMQKVTAQIFVVRNTSKVFQLNLALPLLSEDKNSHGGLEEALAY